MPYERNSLYRNQYPGLSHSQINQRSDSGCKYRDNKDWWEFRRNTFILYTSEAVLDEVAQGDAEISAQRLEILRDFPLLALNQTVQDLAAQFLARSSLPPKAKVDAIHIAAATIHGMDYLLTWNCKHIANAQIQGKLAEISLDFGYVLPILCTPNELMGD